MFWGSYSSLLDQLSFTLIVQLPRKYPILLQLVFIFNLNLSPKKEKKEGKFQNSIKDEYLASSKKELRAFCKTDGQNRIHMSDDIEV